MGFFIEDNELLTKTELIEKRKKIMNEKMQLLQQFKTYVLRYLKKSGEPFEIEYELINNDPKISFKDLKIGTKFIYEKIYFKFNLQTELITGYLKNHYGQLTKLYDKDGDEKIQQVDKGCDIENIRPRPIRRLQTNLSMISDFERQKIIERIQLEVNNMLEQIFKGKIRFDDPEFIKLVKINLYLERQKQEIDQFLGMTQSDFEYKFKF